MIFRAYISRLTSGLVLAGVWKPSSYCHQQQRDLCLIDSRRTPFQGRRGRSQVQLLTSRFSQDCSATPVRLVRGNARFAEYRFGLRIEAASFLRVAISRSADTVLSRIIRIRSYILVSLHAVSAGKTFILTNRTKREHRVKLLASGTKIQMKAASTARLTPRTLFFAVRGYIFR